MYTWLWFWLQWPRTNIMQIFMRSLENKTLSDYFTRGNMYAEFACISGLNALKESGNSLRRMCYSTLIITPFTVQLIIIDVFGAGSVQVFHLVTFWIFIEIQWNLLIPIVSRDTMCKINTAEAPLCNELRTYFFPHRHTVFLSLEYRKLFTDHKNAAILHR